MRIAFHAINGVGLGHLSRATTLAREIRALLPKAQLLVLTNSAYPALLVQAGLDFVRFPPRLADPHADPERVRRALPEPLEEAALKAALDHFRPHLVVFDTHAPPALARHAATLGARSVLVLRELRPEVLSAFLSGPQPTLFDRLVIPHEPGEVELGAALHTLPLVVTGPVVRKLDPDLPAGLSPRRARARGPLVLGMAGGGGQPVDARRFLRAVVDAHILARIRIPTLNTLLIKGPYGVAPDHWDEIPGLTVMGPSEHLGGLLAQASLVISQAGYNAVAELRSLEKPAILVPGSRKSEDQSARAKRLVRVGAAVMARPEARSIADQVEALLLAPQALSRMIEAHRATPLVPKNRATALALLRPVRAPKRVGRVVLVAHDFPPKLGGMETVAQELAVGLVAQGIEVRVYTAKRLGPVSALLKEGTVRQLYTCGPRGVPIDLWGDLLLTLDALLVDQPDVVHLCQAGLGPWVPAIRAALPAAATVHVHGNDLLAPWVNHGGDPLAYRQSLISGLKAAHGVFAVSAFSAGLARAQGLPEERLWVIENSVDCTRFAPGPPDQALAARWGLAPEDELVLTVSRLAPRKGHRQALEALVQVVQARPRALFAFTGENPRGVDELLTRASELGVGPRVRALGRVADADLPALYRRAQVFVLLSEDGDANDVEGFGVALLEAAASGIPTVATRVGGIPEAVADGLTGHLVSPGDTPGAAQAILSLLSDPDRARGLGAAGRARAVERFSSETRILRLLSRWQELVKTKSRYPARTLGHFASAMGGEPAPEPGSLREALATAPHGVALVRLAQQHAATERARAERRREEFARIVKQGGSVRLRASDGGARLLSEALDDCDALGHRPRIETRLRRFAETEFQAYALPRIQAARLEHSVPMAGHAQLLQGLQELPREALGKVSSLRIFLGREAQLNSELTLAAVPETHALRRLFANQGITVLPPPELMRYLSETPAGGPETAMIEPTNRCNLACPTCPTGTGKIKPLPPMGLEQFESVLLGLGRPLKTLALWNYGEPLLHRDLPTMIARAKAARVATVKISTNAHFLDPEMARALLEAGLDVMIVSVDGATQATYETFRKDGSFSRVAENVAWLCAEKKRRGLARPSVELQFIAMRHNEHEIPLIRQLANEWGVDRLRIKTVSADDAASRDLIPKGKLLSRYREDTQTPSVRHPFCAMAWIHTVVNVDGSVTPCCYLRPDLSPDFIMGNIFTTPFSVIWRGERYRAFRAAMLAGRDGLPICGRCRGGTHDLFVANEPVGAH